MSDRSEPQEKDAGSPVPERLIHLADVMAERGLTELEVREGDFFLKLSRAHGGVPPMLAAPGPVPVKADPPPVPRPGGDAHVLVAPLAGLFYRSPAPSVPPFVKEGDRVAFGDVLCIVEAMKVMNEIRADQPGLVSKILAQNGRPVSAGQPLFHLTPLP